MRLAIMQPYFFPYIGYFQLIKSVDKFILFDDVNYIKKGWINRNRIIINEKEFVFTVPLEKASQNKHINEISLMPDNGWKDKMLKTFEAAFKKAPMYLTVFPIVEKIIKLKERNLSTFIANSIFQICKYLEIVTMLEPTSLKYKTTDLKGQNKILKICKLEVADMYINSEGGFELYNKEAFEEQSLKLLFLRSKPITYPRLKGVSIPYLSIIDVMMFNEKQKITEYLKEYELQ